MGDPVELLAHRGVDARVAVAVDVAPQRRGAVDVARCRRRRSGRSPRRARSPAASSSLQPCCWVNGCQRTSGGEVGDGRSCRRELSATGDRPPGPAGAPDASSVRLLAQRPSTETVRSPNAPPSGHYLVTSITRRPTRAIGAGLGEATRRPPRARDRGADRRERLDLDAAEPRDRLAVGALDGVRRRPATASARPPRTSSPAARAASIVSSVWLIVPRPGRAAMTSGSRGRRARSRTR